MRRGRDERTTNRLEERGARTRGHETLRFSERRNSEIERAYRTRWVSPRLPDSDRAQAIARHAESRDRGA